MKRKKEKRVLGLLLASLLLVCACGQNQNAVTVTDSENQNEDRTDSRKEVQNTDQDEEGQESVVTLTMFDKNSMNEEFTDDVAQKIMEETGVKIEMVNPTLEPDERLNVMLSTGEYPDMILMSQGEMVNRYIEAGAFIPLDDLIEEYGPNIQEMYGDILEESRYKDGHIYWLANWYGADTDASAGVLMRRDLLEELAGKERAYSTEPFTLSEYTDLLRKFKEEFPQLEGHDSIALELDADKCNYVGTMSGIYGMKSYDIDEEGNLSYLPASERYGEALLYLSMLYREGLLDKEWVINKTEQWSEKLSGGYVFSTWNSYWDTDAVNDELARTVGEDAQFYCYKVVADDLTADQTTYNGRNGLGWDAIGITDNCSNPEAAMKVADFLASEEGQYLMLWGVEGETWEYQDGIHVPLESFLKKWEEDPDETEATTGVRRWTWFIKNGAGSDGTPYDLTTKYASDEATSFANETFGESDYWDTAEFTGLEPAGNTDLGLKLQNIENLYNRYYPQVITAKTEDEAENLLQQMQGAMESAGLSECNAYITEQYKQRMENW